MPTARFDRSRSGPTALALALAVAVTPTLACRRNRDDATGAAASASAQISAGTPSATGDSSPSASPTVEAPRAPAPPPSAAIARTRALVEDLRWVAAHDKTQNPAKAGEGDASTKCEAAAAAEKELGDPPDPELSALVEEAASLCAFDVPVATAIEALDQLRISPSQASRRLMCEVAARELDRARAVRPKDPKLRGVDARRRQTCPR